MKTKVMNSHQEKNGKKPIPMHDYKKLIKIALDNVPGLEGRQDLERLWSDSADFFETTVWTLEDVLVKAYQLGKSSANK